MSNDIDITPNAADEQEVLVRVDGVSKKFCRSLKKSLWYGLADMAGELNPFAKGKKGQFNGTGTDDLRPGEFWANKDITFELRRGECLGLIGRNGAGKTTLLKMLNGLIKPDTGAITMRGRIGALIALGTGFNPILTGRENIYVNGSILGLAKEEIDRKINDIIDFADIHDFIDSPVQSYSSGMQVRLGFAVATAMDPDVLILDEVLAVGDAAFRAKCYNRIGQLQKKAAVIFVSHSMQQVSQICSSILMLKKGQVAYCGGIRNGVESYNKDNAIESYDKEKTLVIEKPITAAALTFSKDEIEYGESITAQLQLELGEELRGCSIRVTFYGESGLVCAEWNSKLRNAIIDIPGGKCTILLKLGPIHLGPGRYHLAFLINDSSGVFVQYWSLKNHMIRVRGNTIGSSDYQIENIEFSINDETQGGVD
jgi:lipopolysaccharide transport system ATP-binding protein